jgi:hypothetical protein
MATFGIGPNILVVKSPNNNEGINKMILIIASLTVGVITYGFDGHKRDLVDHWSP